MNGRVYDPTLGRFLSADPFVGDVGDSQDYNRYSYLGNNPLGGTDPSGYFSLKDAVKIVAIVVVAYFTAGAALYAMGGGVTGLAAGATATFGQSLAAIAGANGLGLTMGGAIAAGAGAGFASGFAGSLLNGGSIGDAFKAGIIGGAIGAVAGGLTYGIGGSNMNYFERAAAHGVVGGAAESAGGGQFRHGFYAGFATAAASPGISMVPKQVRFIAAAIVGGTASAVGGGKFANGAVTGAFQYLLNDSQQHGTASAADEYETVTAVVELPDSGAPGKLNRKGMSGHSGIAFPGSDGYYDYGPQPGEGGNWSGSSGRPWWDRMASPTGDASFTEVRAFASSQGYKLTTVSVDVSKAQAAAVRAYWDKLYADPGTYRFYGQQCTSTAAASLRAGGFFSGSPLKPATFLDQLRGLRNTAGPNIGKPASIRTYP
jgi:hypothetical protein